MNGTNAHACHIVIYTIYGLAWGDCLFLQGCLAIPQDG